MWCEDPHYMDTMSISGTDVGQIKMNFEQDTDHGVAIKFKQRDTGLLYKTGERDFTVDADWNHVWNIPADEELIGFYGGEQGSGSDMKIVELGIITRKT